MEDERKKGRTRRDKRESEIGIGETARGETAEGERARDVGACLRARKRNRVFLQFNFTGASTREAFTSAGEIDLPVPPPLPPPFNHPLPPPFSLNPPLSRLLLETFLRSPKVTRNLAGFPPEFRLNIIHIAGASRVSFLCGKKGETTTAPSIHFSSLSPLGSGRR